MKRGEIDRGIMNQRGTDQVKSMFRIAGASVPCKSTKESNTKDQLNAKKRERGTPQSPKEKEKPP